MNPIDYLKQYFGYSSFRPLQEEIIRHILSGKDCLVLMPTGGGKSVCFQIPALMLEGTAIVVSPLISLMKDQVEALRANGIAAGALNSNNSEAEYRETWRRLAAGELKLLYVSPERLLADLQMIRQYVRVSMFAIDEAHCISAWGHDFRPEYTQLAQLRTLFPDAPIAAFTATADKVTRDDIVEQLALRSHEMFVSSFDRPNLSLDVRRGYSANDKLRSILDLIRRHRGESGIIYCLSRKTTEQVAAKLREKGIAAGVYHAGLSAQERDLVQDAFINDRVPIVCATIAFGMGIDKSNVRWVVHYNLPKSIENYYQEIGRGGRDGLPCETILFYNIGDIMTLRNFANESGQRDINNEKLDRMQEFAESQVCRRRILLNYFGETMDHDCSNCDVCRNPPQHFDGSVLVQKALSAMARTKQSVGTGTVIDILRASYSADVREKGYDQLKTFGAGRDIPHRDWQDYLLQMLHLGYVEIDYRDDRHLKITEQGNDVLYGRKTAQLAVISREDFSVKGRKRRIQEEIAVQLTPDEQLFEALRKMRAATAEALALPPYVIFSDSTLKDLVLKKPTTLNELLEVSGISVHKQKNYGTDIVNVIRKHLGLKSIRTPRDFVTIQGVVYPISLDILPCLPSWRKAIEAVQHKQYWALWGDETMPIEEVIPQDTDQREAVVRRFTEIITEALGVRVEGEAIIIPQRMEYDETGAPVVSLKCTDFEDGLRQFKAYVEAHDHYPFPGSDVYACSLRRWYQEVGHGRIVVTEAQRLTFEALTELFADVPKTRQQWEKRQTQES